MNTPNPRIPQQLAPRPFTHRQLTRRHVPATAKPYSAPEVLEREAGNYAELDPLLESVPGPVLLADVGPLDGPLRGLGGIEKVPAAGQYTVTAACVGASAATVAVGQENPGAPFRPMELALDRAVAAGA
ncbi:hypothetical protein [Arthrobacter sp. NPDC057009]|uniref:hypothetical protein n=1 Tax=Arthrobacter sp. NPDC057009 TaxID=3345996 RepID=UPI00363A1A11